MTNRRGLTTLILNHVPQKVATWRTVQMVQMVRDAGFELEACTAFSRAGAFHPGKMRVSALN